MKAFKLVLFLIVVVAICGCSDQRTRVVGEYEGHFGRSTEDLNLMPDGRVIQVLRNSGGIIYTNTGTWYYEDGILKFQDFIIAVDLSSAELIHDEDSFKLDPKKVFIAQVEVSGDILSVAPTTLFYWQRVVLNPRANQGITNANKK